MADQEIFDEPNKHINLSIGCPKGGHAEFIVEEGNFVCNICGEYFTDEVKRIYEALKETFES